MDVLNIPFVEKAGIRRGADGYLHLPFSDEVHNHLSTVYAGAQFILAEAASGDYLKTLFPELVGRVIPLLRDAQIKFKRPAHHSLWAYPVVSEEALVKFHEQFANRGRAAIGVQVDVKDDDGAVTLSGDYHWFLQAI